MPIIFIANKAAEELAKIQASLSDSSSIPQTYLWWFLLALALIVAGATSFTLIRKRRHLALFRGLVSISEPYRIAAVLNRAVTRQANCSLEIFDHQHNSTYKGQVFEAKPGVQLILELSRLPGSDLDFGGFPAQVHLTFRPAPKEDMEHYQFTSHTLAVNFQREKTWRVARVAVAWPRSIISAQRRDFLRIEPVGRHAMDEVPIYRATEGRFEPPQGVRPLAEASVMDISVGGIQLIVPGVAAVPDNRENLLVLDLPMDDLDIDLKETRLYLLFNPLDVDVLGLPGGGSKAATEKVTRTVIRGNFTGRYKLDPVNGEWVFSQFSPESFQDLSHWIHAYQRFMLKKDNRTAAVPPERINLYPPKPPVRTTDEDEEDA